jgi:hypothetical protein
MEMVYVIKKVFYLILLFFLMLFVVGCELNVGNISDDDIKRISENAVVCNEPYIRVGLECCLDINNNNICDSDEKEILSNLKDTSEDDTTTTDTSKDDTTTTDTSKDDTTTTDTSKDDTITTDTSEDDTTTTDTSKDDTTTTDTSKDDTTTTDTSKDDDGISCTSECQQSICDGFDYTDCIKASDGCKYLVYQGLTIGKCGVKCLDDNGCSLGNMCDSYQCVSSCSSQCSGDVCDGFDYGQCVDGGDGCKYLVYQGLTVGKCGVKCLDNSDCGLGNMCDSYQCVSSCNNECSSDTCAGYDFIKCSLDASGCKYIENKGVQIGKCGVECIDSTGCSNGDICLQYVCDSYQGNTCSNECSSYTCQGNEYIDCVLSGDGCYYFENKGVLLGQCGVECLVDSDCSDDILCEGHICKNNFVPPMS